MSGVPSLAVLVALPLLGLLLLGLQVAARSGARARAVGTVTLGLTAAAALTILGVFYARGGSTLADGLVPGLAIDRTSVTLPALTSVVGLAVLRLAPRRELDRAAVGSLLWITATTQVVFVSAPLELAAAAAASSTIPVGALMTGAARPSVLAPNRVLMAYGGAPWLAVLAVGAVAGGGSFGPLFGALPPAVGGDERALFVGLVIVAAASRSAIFPAHRWFVGLVREGRAARAILLLAPLPGAYLLLRVATLYPEAFVSHLPWLSLLGLVSEAYFGLVALGQGDQRETVVYLVCSQVGLVFLGLAAVDVLSVDGALLLWLAQGVAGSGLLLCALAVRARRGPVSLDRFHGLVAVAPRPRRPGQAVGGRVAQVHGGAEPHPQRRPRSAGAGRNPFPRRAERGAGARAGRGAGGADWAAEHGGQLRARHRHPGHRRHRLVRRGVLRDVQGQAGRH